MGELDPNATPPPDSGTNWQDLAQILMPLVGAAVPAISPRYGPGIVGGLSAATNAATNMAWRNQEGKRLQWAMDQANQQKAKDQGAATQLGDLFYQSGQGNSLDVMSAQPNPNAPPIRFNAPTKFPMPGDPDYDPNATPAPRPVPQFPADQQIPQGLSKVGQNMSFAEPEQATQLMQLIQEGKYKKGQEPTLAYMMGTASSLKTGQEISGKTREGSTFSARGGDVFTHHIETDANGQGYLTTFQEGVKEPVESMVPIGKPIGVAKNESIFQANDSTYILDHKTGKVKQVMDPVTGAPLTPTKAGVATDPLKDPKERVQMEATIDKIALDGATLYTKDGKAQVDPQKQAGIRATLMRKYGLSAQPGGQGAAPSGGYVRTGTTHDGKRVGQTADGRIVPLPPGQ